MTAKILAIYVLWLMDISLLISFDFLKMSMLPENHQCRKIHRLRRMQQAQVKRMGLTLDLLLL